MALFMMANDVIERSCVLCRRFLHGVTLVFVMAICTNAHAEEGKRIWLAEAKEVKAGSLIVLDSGELRVSWSKMIVSVYAGHGMNEEARPLVDVGELVMYVYTEANNGNYPYVVRVLPRPIDGVISYLEELPLMTTPVKIVIFCRGKTKETLAVTACVAKG